MGVNTIMKTLKLSNASVNENISKWIEQDIIVPDTKPDAIKIVNVTVTPYVDDVEVIKDKIKVSGSINYFIIYQVDEPNLNNRGLFCSYDYSEVLDIKDVDSNMEYEINPICKNTIYSLPNERKISVKSEILFKVKVNKIAQVPLINKFDTESNIECKMCKSEFCNIIQNKKSIIASKEDFMLPKEAEDFYELLNVETRIVNTEFKESYNKIMIKGDLDIKMIYLSESQEENVKKINYTLPFSSMIELENINENSRFDIKYAIQNFDIRLNPDITTTKTMNVDYRIEVNVKMYENEEVEYVEDFYSQDKELRFNSNNIFAVKKSMNLSKTIDVKENVTNIVPENTKLVDYKLDTSNINATLSNNLVKLEGQAKVILLLQDMSNFNLETKVVELMISENFNIENMPSSENYYIDIVGKNINIVQSGQDLEIKIQLKIDTNIEDISNLNIVEDIIDEDLDITNLDSINIYVVKSGDTLWSIAKKYKTSVEKIIKTNEIVEPDVIDIGQKILVIR